MMRIHAPFRKFITHADKYMASMEPKKIKKHADINIFFSQYSAIISDIKQVVVSIPMIIARPAETWNYS